MGIKTRDVRDRLAGVLGRPRELEGLGAVEGSGSANLAGPVRMQTCTLQDCLGSSTSLSAGLSLAYRKESMSENL